MEWNWQSFWSVGFRPFFLLGACLAVIDVVFWLLVLNGVVHYPLLFPPSQWHAHEMVFGFLMAFIVGFLLTAAPNWTGKPKLDGRPLVALFLVFFLARLFAFLPRDLAPLFTAFDLGFGVFFIVSLQRFLWPSRPQNRFLFAILILMVVTNALMHFAAYGAFGVMVPVLNFYHGIFAVSVITLIIAGRVIPFFSSRVIADYQYKPNQTLETLAIGSAAACILVASFELQGWVSVFCALTVAVFNLWRALRWTHRGVWRIPILWVLHLAYFWLILGFLLLALHDVLSLSYFAALHTITVGGFGLMIIGMSTRVALGHTGRKIHAKTATVICYLLIIGAGVLRLVSTVLPAEVYLGGLIAAGVLWCLGFLGYMVIYGPILVAPRADAA